MKRSCIISPSPLLSEYVKHYWMLKDDTKNAIQTIPSGCIHLVIHRGCHLYFSNGNKQPKSFIRGQHSIPGILYPSGPIDMIAIIFHPLGLTPFFTFPVYELYNQYTHIDRIGDTGLRTLKDFLSSEEDTHTCIERIENFLLKRLYNFNDYNYHRIFHAIQSIKNQTLTNVVTLAGNACLGYRHFKREFTRYAGIAPKEYAKVIRFQKTLYALQKAGNMELAELAYSCGFYDHSHLVKDFKSMTGCAPTQYLSSRRPHSTFFSDDCRINLIKQN